MVSDVFPEIDYVALLSAASVADANGNRGALQSIAGRPLLEYQMRALYRRGVVLFLIEVDTIPGELLNLADSFRSNGARVEFVRSARDLQDFLKPDQRLVVQAEAHYFSQAIIDGLVGKKPPFVATLDGRAENALFERIDLNTRWAGFAIIEAAMARSLGELPEGWSIASSLLRLAIQDGIRFEPVAQASLHNGDILPVSNAADADQIVAMMLAARCDQPSGFLEKHLFGNMAKLLAPPIWHSPNGGRIVAVLRIVCATGGASLAILGWGATAALMALMAVFLNAVSNVVRGFDSETNLDRWPHVLFWTMIVISAIFVARTNTVYGSDPSTFVLIAAGLTFLSYKIVLPQWAGPVLRSPALLLLTMLVATTAAIFGPAAKWIVLAQLGMLIAGMYLPADRTRNTNHA